MSIRAKLRSEVLAGFITGLSVFLLAGCASSSDSAKAAAQTPYGLLLQDASKYILSLEEQGKLPGFQKGEHGSITSIPELMSNEGAFTFPVTVVLRATKKGTDSFYRYTIMKSNSGASWKMIEATSWDKDGHVVEQVLPK
jgi:hypothetical protein